MPLLIQCLLPDEAIRHFVHSFWYVENGTEQDIATTVLPNGMVDLSVTKVGEGAWRTLLRGVETQPNKITMAAGTRSFAIGFKLLAVEYVLDGQISTVLNSDKELTSDNWQFTEADLSSLEHFRTKATQQILSAAQAPIDSRKQQLFELIYASAGAMPVQELADKVYWSARQMNRYFNSRFGISLKAYCNVLRFGESMKGISEHKLYPQLDYTDQNHFIKVIKRYSGATPTELSKNEHGRFMNITTIKQLPPKNG